MRIRIGLLGLILALNCCSSSQDVGRRGLASQDPKPTRFFDKGESARHAPVFVLNGDAKSFYVGGTAQGEVKDEAEAYDVVVAGSGLAGLSAALYLSEAKLKVLILEKDNHFGGLASPGEVDGISYDRGAAYWTDTYREEYSIVKHIGLGSYRREDPIPEPIDSYYWKGKLYQGIWDDKTVDALPASFALFKREIQLQNGEKLIPNQPFEEFEKYGGKMDLDSKNAAQWIAEMPCRNRSRSPSDWRSGRLGTRFEKELGQWDCSRATHGGGHDPRMKDVIDLMDLYCRSALGTTADKVSAMAFANFYISEIVTRYTTSVGTGQAAINMRDKLAARANVKMLTESPVTHVKNEDDGVLVEYQSANVRHRVRAKYFVMSAQLKFAPEIIEGFKADRPQQAALIEKLGYSHYSVHNIEVEGNPYRASYDTWSRPDGYKDDDFTDFILGRWIELKGYEGSRDFAHDPPKNGILSIYHPLPQSWMGKDYSDLEAANLAVSATEHLVDVYSPVFKQLATQAGASPAKAELKIISVRTSRWPFSVHIAEPGHFAQKARILRKPYKRVFFGHSNLGTPAFEEALFRGHCAANNVLHRMDPNFKNETWSRCPLD